MLTQVGPQVTVTLTGASFALSRRGGGDHFTGRIEPTQLVFSLSQFDGYYYGSYGDVFYPNIIEEVTGTNYLAIWGRVVAVGTSGSFSGALDGAFELYRAILEPRGTRSGRPLPVSRQSLPALAVVHVPLDAVARNRRRTTFRGRGASSSCRDENHDRDPHRQSAVDSGRDVRSPVCLRWPVSRPPQLNVVVITLDTTRADRLSPYGYMDASMPALERLAREGVIFDRALTVAPLTLPAHSSLFTGLFPPRHGVRDNADRALASKSHDSSGNVAGTRISHGSVRIVGGARIRSRAGTGIRPLRGRADER